jgi:signal transduction histidine kinase
LNECRDVESFQAELVRFLESGLQHTEVLLGTADAVSTALRLPAWIKAHLAQQPGLYRKLQQGEMVGISAFDESPVPRPASAARSSVVLIPLISNGTFLAAIALVAPLDGPQLSAEDIEAVRQFTYETAPILARLQEIERLRHEVQQLSVQANRARDAGQQLATAIAEKNTLEAMLQMRSHLQLNLAHELRTPLAAIRGYTRMILDGRGGALNDTQKEYLRIVSDNTDRLIALVGWMSDVAELSSQHLRLSEFDFRQVWQECGEASRQRLAEKSVTLTEHIAGESFVIIGDREKLADVVREFLALAIRLSNAGGTITAELSRGREGQLNFKVSEQGVSIPPEALSKIFERPFKTLIQPAAQSPDPGAINLSGVYDIIGMHGGRLFVTSSAGQATTLFFTLPAVKAGEDNTHEQAIDSGRRRR